MRPEMDRYGQTWPNMARYGQMSLDLRVYRHTTEKDRLTYAYLHVLKYLANITLFYWKFHLWEQAIQAKRREIAAAAAEAERAL